MPAAAAAVVQQLMAALNAHDGDRFVACFTTDGTWEDVPSGAVFQGVAGLRQYAQLHFGAFPDVQYAFAAPLATDDQAALEYTETGTHQGDLPGFPATGKVVQLRVVSVLELAGDRIQRLREYYDGYGLRQQLGHPIDTPNV
jgi:steroid delta-isomerase-like uncharacterized protein